MKFSALPYLPPSLSRQVPVVQPGEFNIGVTALHHSHIYGMVEALVQAGATLTSVYDEDPAKVAAFQARFPQVQVEKSLEALLHNPTLALIAAADIPSHRAALGLQVMDAGKDYFTDKTPFTTLEQVEQVRHKTTETGRKYMVYFNERLNVESAVYAGYLVDAGVIGRVVQVMGMGPHRLRAETRPDWFFQKEAYGGILCDIGCHHVEQFLFYSGSKTAQVVQSQVANYQNPAYPELEDFGSATLVGENQASGFFRVDWLTPDGLGTWGDGRIFILGTEGYVELRKYINVGVGTQKDNVFYVTNEKEHFVNVHGRVGTPFFGQLILDCIHRTENAMTQEHVLEVGRVSVEAQQKAFRLA